VIEQHLSRMQKTNIWDFNFAGYVEDLMKQDMCLKW
jgi:hypothetical protein